MQAETDAIAEPVASPDYYFEVRATADGLDHIEFVTDGPQVMYTLLLILEGVNNSFEMKFESVSDFIQELANLSRNLEEIKNGKAG